MRVVMMRVVTMRVVTMRSTDVEVAFILRMCSRMRIPSTVHHGHGGRARRGTQRGRPGP